MRLTKGDYFLTHSLYEFNHQNLINMLKNNFFSVNFEESSVNIKRENETLTYKKKPYTRRINPKIGEDTINYEERITCEENLK